MTQRPRKPARPAATPPRFAVHPLSLAALLALAGPAHALPQGGLVVGGQATIQNPSGSLQVITQGTNKAIIDWRSFSIGAGEKVRFDQPSSTAVILNRVTGYEPTSILGQMQSNGQVFLLNPYGVVFGANARIDVGGMVASTLALSNSDFLASRYSLTSTPGVTLGEVRNEGAITAHGGTVVLAGPSVTNAGTIEADRGRVGLAAANSVLVDVEGDGLIFFNAQATDAGNRLQQLGRIRADGGTVELRAAARASFADTVLNMGGVVQARSLGTRNGRVVIDGSSAGIAAVGGQVDVSGAQPGQTGGDVTVTGQNVLVDAGARLDASGDAGGGRVRVGGGWQGHDTDVRNAENVFVAAGAVLKADALTSGNGGTAVVWSDNVTRFGGRASARGGAQGGNGGAIETSGKVGLEVAGTAGYDAAAPAGQLGSVLLDPSDITVATSPNAPGNVSPILFGTSAGLSITVNPSVLDAANATVTLQATNSITFTDPVNLSDTANAGLTAQAGGNINVNAPITTAGAGNTISLRANDPNSPTGTGVVTIGAAGVLNAGAGTILINNTGSSGTNTIGANLTGNAGITVTGPAAIGGTVTAASTGAVQFGGAVTGGNLTTTGATTTFGGTVNLASLSSSVGGTTTLNGNVTTNAGQSFGAVAMNADATLTSTTAGIGIAGAVNGVALTLTLAPAGTSTLGGDITVGNLIAGGTTVLGGNVTTSGNQTYGGVTLNTAAATLTANTITLNGTFAAGANDIAVQALTVAGAGTFTGTGNYRRSGPLAGSTIGLATGTVTNVTVSQAELDSLAGFGTLTFGRSDGTGTITVGGPGTVTLPKTVSLIGSTAPVTFGGAVSGGGDKALSTATGGTTTVNAALSGLTTFSTTGPVTLASDVTTSGTQTYGGAATLTGASHLTGSTLSLGTIAGGGQGLTLTAGTGASLGTASNLASLTADGAGATTLNGSVTSTGNQTYGNVVLGNTLTLDANSVAISGSVTGSGRALTVTTAAASSLGPVGTIASLTTTGAGNVTLNGNVTTTGTQTYGGPITLGGDRTLSGTALALNGATTGANHALTLIGTSTALDAVSGVTTLDTSAGGTATLNGNITATTQTYGPVTLGGPVTLAGTNISLGAVNGGANDLTVSATGTAAFNGTVAAGSLTSDGVGGATTLAGNVATAGDQSYNATSLSAPVAFQTGTGGQITFNSTLAAGGQALNITADGLTITGATSGLGTSAVTVQPTGNAVDVNLATVGGAGSLSLSQATIDKLAGSSLTIGRTGSTATMTAGATLSLPTDTALRNGSGNVVLSAITGNGNDLTVTTSGTSAFGSGVAGVANLTANGGGTTNLSGTIVTTGAQSYSADSVTLTGSATLQGSTVALGTVGGSGAETLTLTAPAGATLGAVSNLAAVTSTAGSTTLTGDVTATTQTFGAVALSGNRVLTGTAVTLGTTTGAGSLGLVATNSRLGPNTSVGSVSANGTATLDGDVTTTGTQAYAAVTLNGDAHLTGSSITINGTTTGASHDLRLSSGGAKTLNAVSGVNSLVSDGAGTTVLNANVSAVTQNYSGTVTIGGPNVTLSGTDITLSGAVNGGANNLTLSPTGTATVAGPVTAGTFTTTSGTTELGGNVTTSGDQTYGIVNLSAPATLAGDTITFNGAFNARSNDLGLELAGLSFGGGGSLAGSGDLRWSGRLATNTISVASTTVADVNLSQGVVNLLAGFGFSSLSIGRANGTGAIDVGTGSSLSLPANLRILGSSAPVTFGGTVTGNNQSLTVTSLGNTTLGATFTGLSSLSVAGTSSLSGSIATSGTQTYGNTVTLTGPATLTGTTLSFNGGSAIVAGANNLVLNARDLVVPGTITGSGGATLGAFAGTETLGLATATATQSAYTAAEIAKFAGFGSLTLGRAADGTGAVTVGAFPLGRDTTITASTGPVALQGAVTGNGHGLRVTTAGTTTVSALPTGLTTLRIDGPTVLAGGTISTVGQQTYGGNVTLTGTTTLDASDIDFGGSLAIGANDLTLQYDGALTGPSSATGTGFVSLAPRNIASTIGVAGGAGTFQVTQATLDSLTLFPNLGVGRADGTGLVTVGALSLPANFRLQSGSGNIDAQSGVAGGNNTLTLSTTGTTTLAGNLSNLSAFAVTGPTRLNGATTVTTGSATFGSTVDGTAGGGSLTVNASGQTVFGGAVGGLGTVFNLTTDAPGTTSLNGNVTAVAAIFGDPVTLNAATTTVSGTAVTFSGAVNGAVAGGNALTVTSAGITTFGQAVGATAPLASLTTDALGSTRIATNISTTGAQTYNDPVTLTGSAVLAGSSVGFGSTLNGLGALTINASAATSFGGAVGAVTPLLSLSTDAAGTTTLPASVQTSGAQTYGDNVTLAAGTTLTGTNIGFGGTVNGAQTLAVNASGTSSFALAVGGTTPLAALTTNAGGLTTLGANVTTSGAQTYNDDVVLTGPVIATGGTVQFAAGLDGNQSLTVNSAGLTRFGGTVGGVTPLASLTTNAGGTTQLGGFVTTNGTQAFGDPVVLLADTTVNGGSVTFSGTVDGNRALTVNASGATTFSANVGATTPLLSLATNVGGSTTLPALVTTTGTQTYGDDVALSAGTALNASGIAFGANLAAAGFGLSTRSDTLTLAGNATGTGALDFAPATATGTMGLGTGAPGTLQIDATLLGKLGSFGSFTLGRADGTGAISAGSFGLSAPTTIVGATAPVAFIGNIAGNGQTLAVTTGGTTSVSGALTGLASFNVPNAALLNGATVTSTGAQTYGSSVTLAGDGTLSGGTLQFGGTVDGPGALTAHSTGGTVFTAPVGAATALASVAVSGPASVNGGSVRTSGAQTWNGALALGADTTVTGTDVSFNGTVDGAHALNVAASGTAAFSAPVGGGTALASLATTNATRLGSSITTTGTQTYGGPVTLTGTTTLAGSSATFAGSLDGAQAFTSNVTGTTTFGGTVGAVSPLASVAVANAAQINGGSVATSGAQAYAGPVALGAATTVTGSTLSFAGTVDGPGALTATAASTLSLDSRVGSTTPLAALAATAPGGTTLNGNVTTTGVQTFTGPLTLAADVTATGSNLAFNGAVDGAHALQANSAGATTFAGTVGATTALTSLTTDAPGSTSLAGNVRTSGAQGYLDATTLVGPATLAGSAVTFGSTLDGTTALTVNAADTRFNGPVGGTTALASLATDAAGTTRIGGTVRTTGAQNYGDALQLEGNATLTASALTLGGTVDGAQALTAAVSGTTTLNGAIGSATPLASLAVGGATAMNAGSVTTTGSQTYGGPVTLAGPTTLAANGLTFGSALDGAQSLTIQNAGTTAFGGAIGAATPLASLTVNGGGTTTLAGASVETSGLQSYGGALQLSGTTRLTGSALSFGGNVSGAQDLTLQTDSLVASGGLAGTGVLGIAPLTASTTIGVAGGTGALQVPQALLSSAGGFTRHVIGRADGTGAIDAGDLTLAANTTIQAGSGGIALNGATNGAFDLALNTGGTTRIAGPVGTTTALRSLATDNQNVAGERTVFDQADASGSVQVVTTGAQTYADPVAASVPVRFVASSVTAEQATNRFAGAVSGNVGSLALVDSGDVTLGDLTLASGGSIQAEGTIAVGGALVLNGGTLTLNSNATPTSGAFTDPDLAGKALAFGISKLEEASATLFQNAGSSVTSAPGSLLVLRTPKNGSILFDEASNRLLGDISAVAGTLNDNATSRFGSTAVTTISLLRINSSEIHVAGAPPADGNQATLRAGLEADAIKLNADTLSTGTDGQIRARLPFDNLQGSQTSLPGLTLVMSPQALTLGGGFGTADPASWIQVKVGNQLGGFLTVRPKGENGANAIILLSGADPKPFYDGAGKITEVRVFYNGDTPRTPQETGALNAVIALVEEARHARFEEAVRTENVSSRLRSGVIAEVGSGRPATVGRESIRMPETCEVPPGKLKCE